MNSYKFSITGGVETKLEPILAFNGDVVGFKDKEGKEYRPIFALEVIDVDGEADEISTESRLEEAGFEGLEYDTTEFTLINDLPNQ